MSYILEALKRSEQERHQGELNHATIDTIMMPPKQVRHQWWPYLLIVILAINLIAYLYFQFSGSADVAKDEQTIALKADASNKGHAYQENHEKEQVKEIETLVANGLDQTIQSTKKPLPDHLLQTPKLTKRYDLNVTSQPSNTLNSYQAKTKNYTEEGFEIIAPKSATKSISSEGLIIPQSHKKNNESESNSQYDYQDNVQEDEQQVDVNAGAKAVVAQKDVLAQPKVESFEGTQHLNDLDLSFQKGIPDIRFNSHIFSSNPADRRVMINDLYLREGQSFSGITIDTIGEFYIVLVKSSQRFKIPVLRDWFSPR